MRLEVGSKPLPGLTLVEPRGRGGFAEVWEAEEGSGSRVAVKFLSSKHGASSCGEIRVIQAIQKLNHPNLLRIHNVWSIPDYIVLSMELAEGSLLELFDAYMGEFKKPLPPELLIGYFRQAASALDYLNGRKHLSEGRRVGYQHCDVKPSNLLMIGETIKLADFGLCLATTSLKTASVRGKTPDFAPPEIFGGYVTDSSDQYSLAVSYYYLRTGRFPFPEVREVNSRHNAFNRPQPDLSMIAAGERRVIEQSLNFEPTKRWTNCTAMVEALAGSLSSAETESPSKAGLTAAAASAGA
jgi:serine/threonine protein kinase, bacterial